MSKLDGKTCGMCRFYENHEGSCHRRAPVAKLVPASYPGSVTWTRAAWPQTQPHQWCGDWEDKHVIS